MRFIVFLFSLTAFCFSEKVPAMAQQGMVALLPGVAKEGCSFAPGVADGGSIGIYLDNGVFARVSNVSFSGVQGKGGSGSYEATGERPKTNGPQPGLTLIGFCNAGVEKCVREEGVVTMQEKGSVIIDAVDAETVRGWIKITEGARKGRYAFLVKRDNKPTFCG